MRAFVQDLVEVGRADFVVQRDPDGFQHVTSVGRSGVAATAARDWRGVGAGDQPGDEGSWIAELARRSARAALRVHIEAVLEALGLPHDVVEHGRTGLRGPIEDLGALRPGGTGGHIRHRPSPHRTARERSGPGHRRLRARRSSSLAAPWVADCGARDPEESRHDRLNSRSARQRRRTRPGLRRSQAPDRVLRRRRTVDPCGTARPPRIQG